MSQARTRTVLVTGPGGSGRTTVAAATALAAARRGTRTLLLTAGGDPVGEAVTGLDVARIDSDRLFRARVLELQERGAAALGLLGATPMEGDELTEPPGAAQFALLSVLSKVRGGGDGGGGDRHGLVVVDMPPLHDAIAVLALPEQLRRYLRRLLPAERQAARALRPVLAQLAGVPMPARWLYETAARWDADLAAAQAVVESPDTTVRLVAEPGPAAAAALRAARTGLALHGHRVDAVVANRLLPAESAGPWLAGLCAQQHEHLKDLIEEFGGARVAELPHLGRDPRGPGDLDLLAYAEPEPAPPAEWTVEDRRTDEGVLLWRIPLPGAVREELALVRRGDELVVTAGPFRRVVALPSALRRCAVSGAALTDGELRIRCTPDPGLWPSAR